MDRHVIFLELLGALLALAAASDVAWRRIPNLIVAPVAAGGIAAQWVAGGPAAAGVSALVGAGVLALLLLPWIGGMLGGGDVKLMAATAVWIGPSNIPPFFAFTAVAGAPVALATWVVHRARLRCAAAAPHDSQPAPPTVARETVPMAVAVALGAFTTLWRGWP